MTAEIVFPDGKFYSCTDPENLTHTEPEEALEEYLDGWLDHKMSVAEVVAAIRKYEVTVSAYNPTEISDGQIEAWADQCLEKLMEDFSEEHADPDSALGDAFPSDAGQLMREAVKNIVRRTSVWSCEVVGKVTLTPDQLEAVMRAYRPDWFKESP